MDEGGSGGCPQVGVLGRIFLERGRGNGCTAFVEGDHVPKAVKREMELNPQEEALF